MKVILNSVMMSIFSILLMTLLTLGMTKLHAQETVQVAQQQTVNSQQELIDIFFAAAKTGNQEVINEFLKHGFPVNVRNGAGYTPLIMAAYYGHQATVTTLLKYGADRCARDNKGNTALMGAIFKLEWAILKQLRQVDCDSNATQTRRKPATETPRSLRSRDRIKRLIH